MDVQRSTATATDPLPADAATGQFDRRTRLVPVRIEVTGRRGLALAAGMNVTVRIHRAG